MKRPSPEEAPRVRTATGSGEEERGDGDKTGGGTGAMSELRLVGRAAAALTLLALLAGALAWHALVRDRADARHGAGVTLMGAMPVVTSLAAGGAADRAGLRVGDVVERIDGRAPGPLAQVERTMASHRRVILVVRRGDRDVDLTIG